MNRRVYAVESAVLALSSVSKGKFPTNTHAYCMHVYVLCHNKM